MHYSLKILAEADRGPVAVSDFDIVLDAEHSLPRAILARLNLQPHYPEVGRDQFDDHLFGVEQADLKGIENLSLVIHAESFELAVSTLARALNYLDILSAHLARAMFRGNCSISLVLGGDHRPVEGRSRK